jgi:hypothetical protein
VSAITAITTGASLKPDSASRIPTARLGSGSARSTENTAAASVEVTAAASSRPTGQLSPSSRWAAVPATATDTATPRVDSTAAGATAGRIVRQRVVSPPSARIRTSAQ